MRTTLEAARATGIPSENIIFEVIEGERVEDGVWFAQILRKCKRTIEGHLFARPAPRALATVDDKVRPAGG